MRASSHPVWGVWIETDLRRLTDTGVMSHPVWGVWIETILARLDGLDLKSHPVWGVWIETMIVKCYSHIKMVTPRMGCVD